MPCPDLLILHFAVECCMRAHKGHSESNSLEPTKKELHLYEMLFIRQGIG